MVEHDLDLSERISSSEKSFGQIESTDNRVQDSGAHVFALMKRKGHRGGFPVDVGVIDHPMGTLSFIRKDFEVAVVVQQHADDHFGIFRLSHRPVPGGNCGALRGPGRSVDGRVPGVLQALRGPRL